VDLGITWVHELIIQPFCEAVVECDTTYYLTTPDFPVYINPVGTGLDGLACVACAVEDAQNVLTPSNTDYATIEIVAAAAGSGSISVTDALFTWPAGTYAGF